MSELGPQCGCSKCKRIDCICVEPPPPASEPSLCEHDVRDGYCSKCNGLIVLGALQTYSQDEIDNAKAYAKRMSAVVNEPAQPAGDSGDPALSKRDSAAVTAEPREWWIYMGASEPQRLIVPIVAWDPNLADYVHVIEKSAYDALKAKYDEACGAVQEYRAQRGEIERLKAENAELARLLDSVTPTSKEIAALVRERDQLRRELSEARAEVERLKEFEFMYKGLSK